jgi:uncharacterized protein
LAKDRGAGCAIYLESSMKYLFWLGLLAVIWWVWSKRKAGDSPPAPRQSRVAEKMVSCAHCGVYLPESDSISDGGLAFCSEAHRALGRQADR